MSRKDKSRSNKKPTSSDGKAQTSEPERLYRKRTRVPENEKSRNSNERENFSGPSRAKKQKTRHQTATQEDLSSSSDISTPSGSQNLFDSRQQSQSRESEAETASSSKSSSFEKYLKVILLQ